MMVGDKRKYNTMLVTLRQVPDRAEGFHGKALWRVVWK